MNILKSILGYTQVPLARLSDKETIQTMSGLMAYVCLQCPTKTVMARAPQGKCEHCGSTAIVPLLSSIETALKWKWQQKKALAREKKREAGQ